MLIPNKTKTSNSFSIVASFDDKGAGSPPGGGTTFVPVVSLEYSLPGPIAGGPRLPPQPQASPSQSLTPRRTRLPRHRAQRHVRNTIAVPPVEIPETAHQIQGIGIHRQERVRLEYWMEPAISPMIRLKSLQSEGYVIRYW
ncbi:hypothetical protein V1264_022950 [Littorina saxatilis]|uniref:Uncharacterized protein n=1 Tax=Littorina saxatilis TaxID=31220 RepID=A0AAN9G9J7_9CAEN